MEMERWDVTGVMELVELVIVFIALVVDMMIADLHVLFAAAQDRTSAFGVEEEDIRNAITAMELVS